MNDPNDRLTAADDRTAGGGIPDAANEEPEDTGGLDEMVSGRFGSDVSDEAED